jgi:hypothetical protein
LHNHFIDVLYTILNILSIYLPIIFKKIALNVPAVYDVFAARIRACVASPGLVAILGTGLLLAHASRAGKMWVECGVGMERSVMT